MTFYDNVICWCARLGRRAHGGRRAQQDWVSATGLHVFVAEKAEVLYRHVIFAHQQDYHVILA